MKPTYIMPHVRTSKRGRVHPVRGHRRGVSFEFMPAAEAPNAGLHLLKLKDKNVPENLRDALEFEGATAFVSGPSDVTRTLPPNTIYMVSTDGYRRGVTRPATHHRVADVISHETLHTVLSAIDEEPASRTLDRPYQKRRLRKHKRDMGGV